MKTNIFRFYTIMGFVMVLLLFLTGLKYPTHLYSPGDLTAKHQDLRCKDCHAPFKKVPTESCQAQNCHPKGKIGKKAMVKDLHESPDFADCTKCHTDHKGDTSKITKAFDHAMLPGGAKDCLSCHKTAYAKGHKDKAREKCADCHDTKDWKKTTFNHATQTAACRDCHNSPKDALHEGITGSCKDCHALDKEWKSATVDHASLPGGGKDCLSCHKTAYAKGHKDKAREKCADCHDTKDWKKTTFNHATQTAACRDCHNSPKDALHEGITGSCKDCHSLDKEWKSATVDHVKYFPLTRSHKVPCSKCHDTGSFNKYTCMNCHEHATRGIIREHQEEGIKNFGDCLRCHSMRIDGQQYGNRRTHESIGGEGGGEEEYRYKGSGKGKGGYDD